MVTEKRILDDLMALSTYAFLSFVLIRENYSYFSVIKQLGLTCIHVC